MGKPTLSPGFFQAAGWRVLGSDELPKTCQLDLVVETDYGILGLVLLENSAGVLDRWSGSQIELANVRRVRSSNQKVDLYLVFVVEEVPINLPAAIQEVESDTHVCRKTVLFQGMRSIEETLSELPFFKKTTVEVTTGESEIISIGLSTPTLPDPVLRDLARASAATILEKLLAGEYKRT